MWLPETINGKRGLILQVLVSNVQADFWQSPFPLPLIREHLAFCTKVSAFCYLEKQSESTLFKRKRKAVNLLKL